MSRTTGRWLPQEVIRRKRDGEVLTADDLNALVRGMADGSLADAQVAAFAMAVYFRGMTPVECAGLTIAMRDIGESYVTVYSPCASSNIGGIGGNNFN